MNKHEPTHPTNHKDFEEAVRQGHESTALATRTIVVTCFALFLVAVGGLGIIALFMREDPTLIQHETTASEDWKRDASAPGVQPHQAYERQRLARENELRLDSYGWNDEDHQTARIPIERALEIMTKRKLQVTWSASQSQEATP